MALNFLKGGRLYWLIYHEIVRSGENVKQMGLFSCSKGLADWLDLEVNNKLTLEDSLIIVKAHQRTTSRLTTDPATTGVSEVAEFKRQRGKKAGNRGGKTVKIVTTKPIAGSKNKTNDKATHQGSFNFPGFASTIDISDVLASVIPNEKRSGTTAKMEPYFIMPSGNQYGIMARERAEALSATQGGAETPATEAALEQIRERMNGANP